MAASITVLGGRSASSGVAATVAYFVPSDSGDYYFAGGEPPGEWFGEGSRALGLSGEVLASPFGNLLAGKSPDGKRELSTQKHIRTRTKNGPPRPNRGEKRDRAARSDRSRKPDDPSDQSAPKQELSRRRHCQGYDITFSVPKSVSAVWAVAEKPIRDAIEQAMKRAVRHTLEWLEREVPLARRGKGGNEEVFAKIAAALFLHGANREGEPQLHVHSCIVNRCLRADGSWASVNGKALMDWTRTLSPMFRAHLGAELRQQGFELERSKDKSNHERAWFAIKGVPRQLGAHWSSRREDIEKLFEESGLTAKDATGQARERANLMTRDKKRPIPPRKELHEMWCKEAESFGFGPRHVEKLRREKPSVDIDTAYQAAREEALKCITDSETHFTFRQALQKTCEAIEAKGVSGIEVAKRLKADLENSPDIVRLGQTGKEHRYTTKAMWDLEERLLNDLGQMRAQRGAQVKESIVDKTLARHSKLTPEQAQAARELLTGSGAVRILTGVAGAGKTQTMIAIREAFERAGVGVVGGAIAGAAKEELVEKAGIKSRTVASYLYHLDKPSWKKIRDRVRHDVRQLIRAAQGKPTYGATRVAFPKNSVVIIDEAGMLDTRTMERLTHHAKKAKATLILGGDYAQLNPIGPGGPFAHFAQKLEASRLTENLRQRNAPEDKEASHAIRTGEAEQALKSYADRGRLTVAKNRKETIQKLVSSWAEDGGAKRPGDCMIFTQTRPEARVVNRLCQAERQREGEVSTAGISVGKERICIGDRIMFLEDCRRLGIENGHRGTVLSLDSVHGCLTVRLDRQPSKELKARGARQTVTVPLDSFEKEGVTLAYAATTHKMQGQSIPKAYLLLGGSMTDRELAYVQTTRGQNTTKLFVDALHAGENLQGLARAIQRSRAKTLAHDVYGESGQAPQLELRIEPNSGPNRKG